MAGSGSVDRLETAPLGILAGGSGVPLELAEAVAARGRAVHIVAIDGEAERAIEAYSHTWVKWGAVGAIMRAFQGAGCRQIVIVGRVSRPNLANLRPDFGFWRSLPALIPLLRGGDDAILRLVIGFFERHGLQVVGAHEAAPELLAPSGVLGGCAPGSADTSAIERGAAVLLALGSFDAAQAAIYGPDGLLAIEGADGTDAMLRRLAQQRGRTLGRGRGVLVKVPKPHQEKRIDLPAIGPETVRRAAEAGLAGIAVQAGQTLLAERRLLAREADVAGLYVIGFEPDEMMQPTIESSHWEHPSSADPLVALQPVGRCNPSIGDRRDAALGARVVAALAPFWSRASTIVSRNYVLTTDGPGGAIGAAERAGRLKPWGARMMRRKSGVLVMSDIAGEIGADPTTLLARAATSGLAGLVVMRAPLHDAALALMAAQADRAGMFLIAPGGRL